MVFDKIQNLNQYLGRSLNSALEEAFKKIKTSPNGEYHIEGEEIFLKLMTYETKLEDFITESHKKYIDLQIVLSWEEIIRIYDANALKIGVEYSEKNDCIFYNTNNVECLNELRLKDGFFAIFLPDDVHETQISPSDQVSTIRKAVLKIDKTRFNA
jgi:YhcH/YjgK/YiaL family protein